MCLDLCIRGTQFLSGIIAFATLFATPRDRISDGYRIWKLDDSFTLALTSIAWVFALSYAIGLWFRVQVRSPYLSMVKLSFGVDAVFTILLLIVACLLADHDMVTVCNNLGHEAVEDSYNCDAFKTSIAFTFFCMFGFMISAGLTLNRNLEVFRGKPSSSVQFGCDNEVATPSERIVCHEEVFYVQSETPSGAPRAIA